MRRAWRPGLPCRSAATRPPGPNSLCLSSTASCLPCFLLPVATNRKNPLLPRLSTARLAEQADERALTENTPGPFANVFAGFAKRVIRHGSPRRGTACGLQVRTGGFARPSGAPEGQAGLRTTSMSRAGPVFAGAERGLLAARRASPYFFLIETSTTSLVSKS